MEENIKNNINRSKKYIDNVLFAEAEYTAEVYVSELDLEDEERENIKQLYIEHYTEQIYKLMK